MSVKLLTKHHLEFLSLKGGCTCSSKSTQIKCHIVGNPMSRVICELNILFAPYTISRATFDVQVCDNNNYRDLYGSNAMFAPQKWLFQFMEGTRQIKLFDVALFIA